MPCPDAPDDYLPYEAFSPSSLSMAGGPEGCMRKYAERYIVGRKEPRIAYADLPPPPPKVKKPTAVDKAKLREYNRIMRPALGTAVHDILHAYFAQNVHTFEPLNDADRAAYELDLATAWESRPGQIALSGLQLLPHPGNCIDVLLESPLTLDLSFCTSDPEPPHLHGFLDLVATPDVVAATTGTHLYDYKTTYDFKWCKTTEELQEDEQAAAYALNVMQWRDTREVKSPQSQHCTWVYFRTEGAPASEPVRFTVARAQAEDRVGRMVELAGALRDLMHQLPVDHSKADRIRLAVEQPQNPTACSAYGGCVYHKDKGGPCSPAAPSLGVSYLTRAKVARVTEDRKQARRERRGTTKGKDTMANETFAQKRARLAKEKADGGAAPAAKPATTRKPAAAAKPAAEKPAKPRKPRGASRAKPDPEPSEALQLVCGEVSVEIPADSPLHAQLFGVLAAHEAASTAADALNAALGLEG